VLVGNGHHALAIQAKGIGFEDEIGGCHGPSLCGKCKKLITDREECLSDSG